LFVGPKKYLSSNVLAKKIFETNEYSNLKHIPPQHFKKLKYFIADAKVCLAPMSHDIPGNMINHHKLLQYFSQGKVVLSPKFSEYINSPKDFIYMYSDISEVIDIFAIALKDSNNQFNEKQRIEFAERNQYSQLIQSVEQFLD
jgi:hypothetical protein